MAGINEYKAFDVLSVHETNEPVVHNRQSIQAKEKRKRRPRASGVDYLGHATQPDAKRAGPSGAHHIVFEDLSYG